ncbi:MAG: TIGR04282 family arsenosugar biosynthesis glycosyltransferase [Thermoplasmatota archaeon]
MKEILVLMVKAPVKGKVKTRLALDMGDAPALELYRSFVMDMLDGLEGDGYSPAIGCYPPEDLDVIKDWLEKDREYMIQKGSDIGERQGSLFKEAFRKGAEKAVVMSSDCPDIDIGLVRSAFKELDEHDCVICPAEDGGYCLIGFKKSGYKGWPYREINWSTPEVMDQMRGTAERSGIDLLDLGCCFDIDDGEGLLSFLKRPGSDKRAPRTWRTAKDLGIGNENGLNRSAP